MFKKQKYNFLLTFKISNNELLVEEKIYELYIYNNKNI